MTVVQDVKYAVRAFSNQKLFTMAAVASLALGIGANTAIFSLLNSLILRPLPVSEPDTLVKITWSSNRFKDQWGVNGVVFSSYANRSTLLSDLMATNWAQANLTADGQTERITTELVTGNYFEALGVQPVIGRVFTREENVAADGHPVVVLSHSYWKRRFARNPAVLGKTVRLNDHPMTVIGVMNPKFFGLNPGFVPELWLPSMMVAQVRPEWKPANFNTSMWLGPIARLRRGRDMRQARLELETIHRQALLEQEASASEERKRVIRNLRIDLVPAAAGVVALGINFERPLVILLGIAGLVLLIASVNVANLLLTRAVGRRREIAVRVALGATRRHVIRQLLVESLLLSGTGACFGILLAAWLSEFLFALVPAGRITLAADVTPDWRVLLFTAAVAGVTGIAFGLVPAIQSWVHDVTRALKGEPPKTARFRTGKLLVSAQVAITVVLLFGGVLLSRSLIGLRNVPVGFERQKLLIASVNPGLSGYTGEKIVAFYDELVPRVSRLPGVQSAALERIGLLGVPFGVGKMATTVEGYQATDNEVDNPLLAPDRIVAGPNYFRTIGARVLVGREFSESDTANSLKVAIVNEQFANYYFRGVNPIGRHIGWAGKADAQIIGVVQDIRHYKIRQESVRSWYVPYAQADLVRWPQMSLHIRTSGDPGNIASAVRHEVRSMNPNVPVFDVKTIDVRVRENLFTERLLAMLSGSFALLASLLAAIGLYGVLAYTVKLRVRELGIRMALGAERSTITWLILRDSVMLVASGVIVGAPVAYAVSRTVASFVYGVSPRDGVSLAAAVGVVIAVTTVAAWLPAYRASTLSPTIALRYE
jgi:predicted permease